MTKFTVALIGLLLSGCATRESILDPYVNIPTNCEDIDAEICSIAGYDSKVLTARNVEETIIAGGSAAIALGYLRPEFAGVVAGASLISNGVRVGTHEQRIEHLAKIRELKYNCSPLKCSENVVSVVSSEGARSELSY